MNKLNHQIHNFIKVNWIRYILIRSLFYWVGLVNQPNQSQQYHVISHIFLVIGSNNDVILNYRKVSNIRRTKSQNLNASRLIL